MYNVFDVFEYIKQNDFRIKMIIMKQQILLLKLIMVNILEGKLLIKFRAKLTIKIFILTFCRPDFLKLCKSLKFFRTPLKEFGNFLSSQIQTQIFKEFVGKI